MFKCTDCDNRPALLEANGWCGTKPIPTDTATGRPGLLPLLVGEPVDACPRAMGLQDPDVLVWGEMVPRPGRSSAFEGESLLMLPPRYRAVVGLAREWLAAWERSREGPPQ